MDYMGRELGNSRYGTTAGSRCSWVPSGQSGQEDIYLLFCEAIKIVFMCNAMTLSSPKSLGVISADCNESSQDDILMRSIQSTFPSMPYATSMRLHNSFNLEEPSISHRKRLAKVPFEIGNLKATYTDQDSRLENTPPFNSGIGALGSYH